MLSAKAAMRRHLLFAAAWTLLIGGTAAAWSVLAPLDGAVVAPGSVVVESNVKKVQHPTGGVVGEIHVKEGQQVALGELLVRLDDTVTRANLGIIVNELTAMRVRQSRLAAERDGRDAIVFPKDIVARANNQSDVLDMITGERQVHATRSTTRSGQKAQLYERIGQLQLEISGLIEQRKSTEAQLSVAREENKDLRSLQAKGLVQKPRVTALEREIARNEGTLGEIIAKISQAHGKITETELQILQLDKESGSEVAKESREVETKIGELNERRTAAEDQLKRIEIRSPIGGIVHQLNVHTIGGVISQTEPLMMIVPQTDRLLVEMRINPQDIDQVRLGQQTRIRFSAFNQRTTPELNGTLFRIASDLTREPQTGLAYYMAAVAVTDDELLKINDMRLLPGMPAEVYIRTGERTLASYILKPLTDQMQRGLKER